MAYDKNNKQIDGLFNKEIRTLPEDKDLKSNAILNNFKIEHGRIMNEHAEEYTGLLREYITNSRNSARQKKWFKTVFFIVAVSMLASSFVIFGFISVKLIGKGWKDVDTTALAGLISSLVGLLSLYIVIPKIIADYLFNQKEDENMTKMVESIQVYDEKIFSSMNEYSFGEAIDEEGASHKMKHLKEEAEDKSDKEKPSTDDQGTGGSSDNDKGA